jgi:hypothetical protein
LLGRNDIEKWIEIDHKADQFVELLLIATEFGGSGRKFFLEG